MCVLSRFARDWINLDANVKGQGSGFLKLKQVTGRTASTFITHICICGWVSVANLTLFPNPSELYNCQKASMKEGWVNYNKMVTLLTLGHGHLNRLQTYYERQKQHAFMWNLRQTLRYLRALAFSHPKPTAGPIRSDPIRSVWPYVMYMWCTYTHES